MDKELLRGLSEEQIAKAKACKNTDEILSLAKEEGVALSDEQLAAVSGGGCFSTNKCPKCGSTDFEKEIKYTGPSGGIENVYCTCNKCGAKWLK